MDCSTSVEKKCLLIFSFPQSMCNFYVLCMFLGKCQHAKTNTVLCQYMVNGLNVFL